jgi:hypothetical protein
MSDELQMPFDGGGELDNDQLQAGDTLFEGDFDPLDEGYNPPDREPARKWGETEWEVAVGESLDQRLAEEEPDVWDDEFDAGDQARAGRIVMADDDDLMDDNPNRENSVYGEDIGVDGAGASAEEAALHIVDDI